MAIVQAGKSAGSITVEATSTGLLGATASVSTKQTALRPQVGIWQRPIPKGAGITGLWKSTSVPTGFMAMVLGSPRIFTLIQEGGKLSGTVEGPGGWFGGDDAAVSITDGSVLGDRVAFKSGMNSFEGKINGGQLELNRSVKIPFTMPTPKKEDASRPAIGPAPDGSDPSIDFAGMATTSPTMTVVLKRAER
jgi:beta-galactosidase